MAAKKRRKKTTGPKKTRRASSRRRSAARTPKAQVTIIRAGNPSKPQKARRSFRRRSNPDMGAMGKAALAGGVGLAVGLAASFAMPHLVQQASPRVIGAALAGAGIVAGGLVAKSNPAVGYSIAAVGAGMGVPIFVGSFGQPQPQPQTQGLYGLGSLEQQVGLLGRGSADDLYRSSVPSAASLGWFG